MLSRSDDLRLDVDGKPWAFIRPLCAHPAGCRVAFGLSWLACLALGVWLFGGVGRLPQALLFGGCGLAPVAALAGSVWMRRRVGRHRLNGELAARAIRAEMARAPANDRLFAVVYTDDDTHLEVLAFFQEGNGRQRLETVRVPRVGDGSKRTDTDPAVVHSTLARYFDVAQIDQLNVVQLGAVRASMLTEHLRRQA